MKSLTFLLLIIVLCMSNRIYAQWTIKNINEESYHSGIIKFKNDSLGIWMKSNCSVIDGYDTGSSVLKTTDTGETWETKPLNINFDFYDFQFVGDSSIFAICHCGLYTDNSRSILLKSDNLGENWDSIAIFPKQTIETLHFFDNDTGIIAGYNCFYRTTNGGSSWDTISVSQDSFDTITNLCSPTLEKGYATGVKSTSQHYYSYILMKTEDKGTTWNIISSFSNELTSIYFIDENTGFVGTESDTIYKTTDGGLTWAGTQITNKEYNVVRSIQFVSDTIGFATGRLGPVTGDGGYSTNFFIAKTIDGGETWNSYDTLGIPLTCIHFISDSTGFVAGYYELIMKTNGKKINQLPNNYPWHLAKSHGIDENKISNSEAFIYPNPTNGILFVQNRNSTKEIKSINITNITGQIIVNSKPVYYNKPISFDLSYFKAGMYLISIRYSNKTKTLKILKR